MSALWEQVEAGGRREEQRHQEVLQLYAELQEQQTQQIRAHLERERHKREQVCVIWLQTRLQTRQDVSHSVLKPHNMLYSSDSTHLLK